MPSVSLASNIVVSFSIGIYSTSLSISSKIPNIICCTEPIEGFQSFRLNFQILLYPIIDMSSSKKSRKQRRQGSRGTKNIRTTLRPKLGDFKRKREENESRELTTNVQVMRT
jgi:hypothetical protein